MPKYYCDYCKSYLTHDTMSVRKSHLAGKNHIRLYCQYYEEKARQLGLWDLTEDQYDVDLDYLTSQAPSPESFAKQQLRETEKNQLVKREAEDQQDPYCLPPPPTLPNMPPPPPSVLRHAEEDQKSIAIHQARDRPIIWWLRLYIIEFRRNRKKVWHNT